MSLSFGSGPFGSDPGVPPTMPPPTATVTVFAKALNYNDLLPPIVLAVPHAAGSLSLALPTGAGARLGTLPANRIFRVTALKFPGTTAEEVLGIYEAAGIDVPGDTLTGLTGTENFANVALPAGTTIEIRTTAKDLGEIQDAINALEAVAPTTVSTAGSYADPAWITSLAGSKVVGDIPGDAAGITGSIAESQVTGLGADLAGKQPAGAYLTALTGDGTAAGPGSAAFTLADTGVTPGSYTNAGITVDAKGRVTAAASGSAGGTPGGPAGAIQTNDGAGGFAGPAHARVNAAGSLKIDGQAGEYPIEVFTADGTTPIFRVVNSSGDVFGAGTYSSGVGFRATAFGAYVGVSAANRFTFPGASPSILANPLGASTSVFGVQGATGQTANLQEWLDSTGAVLASVGPDGTFTGSGAGLTGIAGSQVSGDIAGNAANVTGTVAIAHGGTGQVSAGAAFNALSPITTTGDLIYGSAANTAGRLAGPTSATKQFLTSTGTGSAAQAPAWGPVAAADVSGLGTAATHASTDYLLAANNLSDVTAATARTNLGLGTAATHPDTDFLAPTGSGSGLTALNASALASGTVPLARLPAANGRLTATVTTTSSTLGTNALTNLGFAIGASEVWTVEWNLTVTGSTAGMKFDVTGPASPTDLRISVIGNTSAITATSAETITAFSTASAAYVLYATTSGQVRIVACVNNGANAGTVQLRFGSATNTQSNSVLLNSYMTARRIG